jgi:quercetin dioxygenase-like cupin family protein
VPQNLAMIDLLRCPWGFGLAWLVLSGASHYAEVVATPQAGRTETWFAMIAGAWNHFHLERIYSLNSVKTFKVFGEPVEILVPGEMTGGRSATLTQVSPPGGGPPPHVHTNEDETFFVLEGEYEFLENGQWLKGQPDRAIQAMRGSVHTFRNVGTTTGKMLIFVAPSGMERYLEEISPLSMPEDLSQLLAISERYGISFPQ